MDESRPYEKYGSRLKQEYDAYKRRMKQEGKRYVLQDAADTIHCAVPTFSNYLRGTRKMADDDYKAIARAWGVRPSYLKCEDEYRTYKDQHDSINDTRLELIEEHIHYLTVLGYDVSSQMYLRIRRDALPLIWEDVKTTLTDDELALKFANGVTLQEWDGTDIDNLLEHETNDQIKRAFYDGFTVTKALWKSSARSGSLHRDNKRVGFYSLKYCIAPEGGEPYILSENNFELLLEQIGKHIAAAVDFSVHNKVERTIIPEKP